MATRPSFNKCWNLFKKVNVSVASVGTLIGGKVETNIKLGANGGFENACPIRLSYILNYAGTKLPGPKRGYAVVSGQDGKWYMYRVPDMIRFLERTWGKANKISKNAKPTDFSTARGIISVQGTGWNNATGHVTLWNGNRCLDSCHLAQDPDNGTFVPTLAKLWTLP